MLQNLLTLQIKMNTQGDVVLLHPPCSLLQVKQVYNSTGVDKKVYIPEVCHGRIVIAKCPEHVCTESAKTAWVDCSDPNGVALMFVWCFNGSGVDRDCRKLEMIIFGHGGAHHHAIVVGERKMPP